jgi:hypothetical protein
VTLGLYSEGAGLYPGLAAPVLDEALLAVGHSALGRMTENTVSET